MLGPIADILGWIMDWLFKFTSIFGIENIGLCIILFTLVTAAVLQADGSHAAGDFCYPEKV